VARDAWRHQPRWPRESPPDAEGHGQGGRWADGDAAARGLGGWAAAVSGRLAGDRGLELHHIGGEPRRIRADTLYGDMQEPGGGTQRVRLASRPGILTIESAEFTGTHVRLRESGGRVHEVPRDEQVIAVRVDQPQDDGWRAGGTWSMIDVVSRMMPMADIEVQVKDPTGRWSGITALSEGRGYQVVFHATGHRQHMLFDTLVETRTREIPPAPSPVALPDGAASPPIVGTAAEVAHHMRAGANLQVHDPGSELDQWFDVADARFASHGQVELFVNGEWEVFDDGEKLDYVHIDTGQWDWQMARRAAYNRRSRRRCPADCRGRGQARGPERGPTYIRCRPVWHMER